MPLIVIPDRHEKHHLGENNPVEIIVHHSTTPDGRTLSWQAIRLDHMALVPWSNWLKTPMDDVGYHIGCERVNDYYELIVGRPSTWVGGHCPQDGMNNKSLGACVIGNFDLPPGPDEDREGQLIKLVRGWLVPNMYRYHIPLTQVRGHFEHARDGRTCPGKLFPWDWFRTKIREEMS